jgi:molybdenum cofactor cytidylyltransferase
VKPTIAGVIVAAGFSTRMGESKPLVSIGGRPMLQWVVDAAEASGLDRVIIVTGPGDREIRSSIKTNRAYFARNEHPGLGTMSSLRTGVAAAGPADAVMKLVADQPEITSADIDALIGAWDMDHHTAGLMSYTDGPGHPLLITRQLLETILDEDGDRLAWRLIEQAGEAVVHVARHRPRPVDVNEPADLELVRARLLEAEAGRRP